MAKIKTPQENCARSARKILGFLGVLQGKTAKKWSKNGSPTRPNSGEILAKIKTPNFELLEILAKIKEPKFFGRFER